MHFVLPKEALALPLASVAGAADQRGTLPILSSVLLKTIDARLSLLCGDSGMVGRALVGCEIKERGELAVDARRLLELVKAIPEKTMLDISTDDTTLTVRAGRSRFKLPIFDAADYPRIAPSKDYRVAIKMDCKRLLTMLDQVIDAMASSDIRAMLNGAMFALEKGGLWIVSTDCHRMHVAFESIPSVDAQEPVSLILPRRTVIQARRLLSQSVGIATITLGSSDLQLSLEDGSVLFGKSIDAKFPDWRRVVPATVHTATVTTSKVQQTISMLLTVPTGNGKKDVTAGRVSLTFDKFTMLLERGEDGRCELDAEADSPEAVTIGVNLDYLNTAILSIGDKVEKVQIGYAGGENPLTVRPFDADFPVAVVMPIRL